MGNGVAGANRANEVEYRQTSGLAQDLAGKLGRERWLPAHAVVRPVPHWHCLQFCMQYRCPMSVGCSIHSPRWTTSACRAP